MHILQVFKGVISAHFKMTDRGTQARQGAMKPVARQAGVTIGGHGVAPTQKTPNEPSN